MKEFTASSQQLRITLAGSEHVVQAGTTAGAALGPDSDVIAAQVNGELRDLACLPADGDVVEPAEIASDDGRYILPHSAPHVMAQAVQELFPQAKLAWEVMITECNEQSVTNRSQSAHIDAPNTSGVAGRQRGRLRPDCPVLRAGCCR